MIHRYAGPSCYAGRWGLETPHIDRLAKEGVRCTNAYVSPPTCGPSRAGLITGRHQCRFGHEFNSPRQEGVGLPLTEATTRERHDLKEKEPAVFSQLKAPYDRWERQLPEPRWPFGGSGQMGRW